VRSGTEMRQPLLTTTGILIRGAADTLLLSPPLIITEEQIQADPSRAIRRAVCMPLTDARVDTLSASRLARGRRALFVDPDYSIRIRPASVQDLVRCRKRDRSVPSTIGTATAPERFAEAHSTLFRLTQSDDSHHWDARLMRGHDTPRITSRHPRRGRP